MIFGAARHVIELIAQKYQHLMTHASRLRHSSFLCCIWIIFLPVMRILGLGNVSKNYKRESTIRAQRSFQRQGSRAAKKKRKPREIALKVESRVCQRAVSLENLFQQKTRRKRINSGICRAEEHFDKLIVTPKASEQLKMYS